MCGITCTRIDTERAIDSLHRTGMLTGAESLLKIADLAEGLSGRALRKLPFQAHAYYVQVSKHNNLRLSSSAYFAFCSSTGVTAACSEAGMSKHHNLGTTALTIARLIRRACIRNTCRRVNRSCVPFFRCCVFSIASTSFFVRMQGPIYRIIIIIDSDEFPTFVCPWTLKL